MKLDVYLFESVNLSMTEYCVEAEALSPTAVECALSAGGEAEHRMSITNWKYGKNTEHLSFLGVGLDGIHYVGIAKLAKPPLELRTVRMSTVQLVALKNAMILYPWPKDNPSWGEHRALLEMIEDTLPEDGHILHDWTL